ncbi:hypothetical protein [Haloarchaeobius baliensis]|uniref:hypothetical protein n=1 Tax=Haloarchaeobius baliensis TaxID=1670458 RepID=UPI003F8813AE
MKDRVVTIGLILALCSVSFLAGYQIHEPRVVTETETVTEVEEVEVPKVIEEDPNQLVAQSDYYYLECDEYVPPEDRVIESADNGGGETEDYTDNKAFRLVYDKDSGAFIALKDYTEDFEHEEIAEAKEDRLIEKYCPHPEGGDGS